MPESRTGRRRTRAVAAALAAMGVLAGCSGGGHGAPKPSTPAVGQASVIAEVGTTAPIAKAVAADPATAGGPRGISSGPDGSIYLSLPSSVVRIGQKGVVSSLAASAAATSGTAVPRGVVALPDGSFVTATDGQIVRMGAGQPTTAIAGVKNSYRSLSAPVPAGGQATAIRFTSAVSPIGMLGDGSVVLADGDALWLVRAGKLTRLYQRPAVKDASGHYQPSLRADGAAVSPTGHIFLLPLTGASGGLGDVVTVSPTGTAGHLALPSSVGGVTGGPARLTPLWLSTDGASGVYVHAVGAGHGDYVLHVDGSGGATLAAASSAAGSASCGVSKPTGAAKFPCALPRAVIFQPGLLVLAAGEPYVVGVRLPKPKG